MADKESKLAGRDLFTTAGVIFKKEQAEQTGGFYEGPERGSKAWDQGVYLTAKKIWAEQEGVTEAEAEKSKAFRKAYVDSAKKRAGGSFFKGKGNTLLSKLEESHGAAWEDNYRLRGQGFSVND